MSDAPRLQVSVLRQARGWASLVLLHRDAGKQYTSGPFNPTDPASVQRVVRKFAAQRGVDVALLLDALREPSEQVAQRNASTHAPPRTVSPAFEPQPVSSAPRAVAAAQPATPSTSPAAESPPPRNAPAARAASACNLRFLRRDQLAEIPPPSWLVQGVLPTNALALLYGERSSYKSFLALDLACGIATGTLWHGHTVQEGCVLLIAAEGSSGLHDRLAAWEQAHQRRADRLLVLPRPVSLLADGNGDALVEALREALTPGERPVLVIVDTLHLCTPGGDENSAGTASQALATLSVVRRAFGCTCVLLHHPTKSNAQQHRGTGAYADDVDVVIRAARDGNTVTLHCEKQRDAEAFQPITLALEPQADSLVARLADERGDAPLTPHGLRPADRRVLAVLCDFREEAVSFTRLNDVAEVSKATLARSLRNLLDTGFVEKVKVGARSFAYQVTGSGIEEHRRSQGLSETSSRSHETSVEQGSESLQSEGLKVSSEVSSRSHETFHNTQVSRSHWSHPPLGGGPTMRPERETSGPAADDMKVSRPGEPS